MPGRAVKWGVVPPRPEITDKRFAAIEPGPVRDKLLKTAQENWDKRWAQWAKKSAS